MRSISPAAYFESGDRPILLDVRSPAEFTAGHAPGAVNLPLFDNAERAEVGTLYKQVGPDDALLRGLEIAGGKMRQLVEEARKAAPAGSAVVQCWRGGQRSASVALLLERAGMPVQQFAGGYKAYRAYVREWLGQAHHPLRVLSGPTGSGKTPVLRALRERGAAVVDLEGLANHKGSSFGALGEDPQPSTEEFENLLFAALHAIPGGTAVWLEDESRMIGTVCQPEVFYERLVSAPAVELVQPTEWRVRNLVSDYAGYSVEGLTAAFVRLRKKLGGNHLQAALAAIERGDAEEACRIALVYYDKAYAHYASKKPTGQLVRLEARQRDPAVIARQLLELP